MVLESLMTRRYMKKSHQISTLTKRKQDELFTSLQKVVVCPTHSFRQCLYWDRNRKGVISSLNDFLLASQFYGRCQKGLLIYTPYTWIAIQLVRICHVCGQIITLSSILNYEITSFWVFTPYMLLYCIYLFNSLFIFFIIASNDSPRYVKVCSF